MSQAISTAPADQKLTAWVAKPEVRTTIARAIAGYMDPDEFIAHLVIHIQSKPELAECSVASQYTAIHTCAMFGLLPGHQHVALIPRAKQITVMPQWQGFKALMERHPLVLECGKPMMVHVTDKIEWAGDSDEITVAMHAFNPLDPNRKVEKLQDILGGYTKIRMRDGSIRCHVIRADYIEKCRKCAQTQNVWNNWFEQQAMKTVLRSAYSRRIIPIDPLVQGRVEAFLAHEDALLGNDPRMVDTRVETLPASSRTAMIAQQINQRAAANTTFENAPVIQQASTLPAEETPEPVAEETPEPEQEQQQTTEPAGDNDAVADFVDMWQQVTVQSELALKKLLNHFVSLTPPLSDEDRLRVQQKHDAILATLNKAPKRGQQQKPLVD